MLPDRVPTSLRPVPLAAYASMAGMALTASASVAAVLGFWRVAADPGWTGPFFVTRGPLSRYQLWFAAALAAQACALLLKRLADRQKAAAAADHP